MTSNALGGLPLVRDPELLDELVNSAGGGPTRQESHQAVRENLLQIALDASVARCGACWLALLALVSLFVVIVLIWSENIYDAHSKDACDQPLAMMLRCLYIIIIINIFRREIIKCVLCYDMARDGPVPPQRVRIFEQTSCAAAVTWPLLAVYMLSHAKTCSSELQKAVRMIMVCYIAGAAVVAVLPVLFVSVMLCLVRRGLVHAPRSASAPDNLIDEFPVIPFDATLFDDDNAEGYASSCSICIEDFDAALSISQTPCTQTHVFHTECLRGWLKCSQTCPLCRQNLVEASASSIESGQRSGGTSHSSGTAEGVRA